MQRADGVDFEACDCITQCKIMPVLVTGAVETLPIRFLGGGNGRSPVGSVTEVVDEFSKAQMIDTVR